MQTAQVICNFRSWTRGKPEIYSFLSVQHNNLSNIQTQLFFHCTQPQFLPTLGPDVITQAQAQGKQPRSVHLQEPERVLNWSLLIVTKKHQSQSTNAAAFSFICGPTICPHLLKPALHTRRRKLRNGLQVYAVENVVTPNIRPYSLCKTAFGIFPLHAST